MSSEKLLISDNICT